jgi:hypothetical protein
LLRYTLPRAVHDLKRKECVMSNHGIRKVLWWICLFIAPLVLAVIELFHPAGFTQNPGMYQYVSQPQPYNPAYQALAYPGPHWWFLLHTIQTPMVALVAVGLWLMVRRVEDVHGSVAVFFSWLSRLATFIFLIYYTALDSIGGSGMARTILNTQSLASQGHLTPDQVSGVVLVLNTTWVDPWVGGVGSAISLTGSWAAFAAALFVAVALWLARKAPLPALLFLIGFGWELQMSHTMPHGPIAFSLLIISAFWIWWSDRRAVGGQKPL